MNNVVLLDDLTAKAPNGRQLLADPRTSRSGELLDDIANYRLNPSEGHND